MIEKIVISQHTEQHLSSDTINKEWEKSYVAAVERNGMLRKALDNRDAEIARLREENVCQAATIKKQNVEISHFVETLRGIRAKEEEQEARKRELQIQVSLTNCVHDLDLCIQENCSLRAENAKLLSKLEKYKAALLDLEGSMCASSDHSKELANSINKVLENG